MMKQTNESHKSEIARLRQGIESLQEYLSSEIEERTIGMNRAADEEFYQQQKNMLYVYEVIQSHLQAILLPSALEEED